MRVRGTQVPVLALATAAAGRSGGRDPGAPELRERRLHGAGAHADRDDPIAPCAQEGARRLRLVVRLEQLDEAVLGAQEDAARADGRHLAHLLDAREAEPALVDPERALEVA